MCVSVTEQTDMKLLCSQLKGNCFLRNLSLTVYCLLSSAQVPLPLCTSQCDVSDSALFSARVANCVYFWYSTAHFSAQYLCRFTRKFTSDFSHQRCFHISCSILSRQLSWSTAIEAWLQMSCEQSVQLYVHSGLHSGDITVQLKLQWDYWAYAINRWNSSLPFSFCLPPFITSLVYSSLLFILAFRT